MDQAAFADLEKGTWITLICGGHGPSDPDDPYRLCVVMQWGWIGRFSRIEGDCVYLTEPRSQQFSWTNSGTGEPVTPEEIGAPLDLIGAWKRGQHDDDLDFTRKENWEWSLQD